MRYFAVMLVLCAACQTADNGPRRIEVLFLGHESRHHDAQTYAPLLASALATHGINISYTNAVSSLSKDVLSRYDALLLYANHDSISQAQERALLDFVASGKGFLPVHSASYCFRNSEAFIRLVGAQFESHGAGIFTADIVQPDHALMQGFAAFETWDETYVHTMHADDRTILMERREDGHVEPWTWTRTHGKGRIFYTAYGHDERTWSNPGFHELMRRGILWAVGNEGRAQAEAFSIAPLEYILHDSIPNYEERDPPPLYQLPLDAEQSQQHIQVPPGFRLELFAAEPLIRNPMAMAWDDGGRLFVIETTDYPNERKDTPHGNDRIKILEDTDGDGRADTAKVFAEGLSIPTSLTPARGGWIVSQAPDMLFLKDTDGDDRADMREVLFTGFGTYDTHAGPSNLRYGFDNWIWGTVGYANFEGMVGADSLRFAQGAYRFKSTGDKLESIATFTNNTWGLGFSEAFDVFGSTANNEHSVYVAIFDRYYAGVTGLKGDGKIKLDGHYAIRPITQNVRQVDVWMGLTAAAGHSLYTARDFPEEYWNRIAFVSEPTGHLLHQAIIEPSGSGYVERDGWNLLASSDEWVSPVQAEVGPDGAVWVLDWYNFIVQHNPTPEGFGTGAGNAHINVLRDKAHGRIYRIVYEGARPTPYPALGGANSLVRALAHSNMFWRMVAQRRLVEGQMTEAAPALIRLVGSKGVDQAGLNSPAVHALWTLHGLGLLDGGDEAALAAAYGALRHAAAGVRKNALRVLPHSAASTRAIMDAGVLVDKDLGVRLAALLALSQMPPSEAVGRALYAESQRSEVIGDVWLGEGLYIAAAAHKDGFLAAYQKDVAGADADTFAAVEWSGSGLDDADWQTMELPKAWRRTTDLQSFDGVVWFRKEVTLPGATSDLTLGLGGIYDSDVTYVNGTVVGASKNAYSNKRVYAVPSSVLRPGRNVIAVRVEDIFGNGGFRGEPEDLYLRGAGTDLTLADTWRYKVEVEYPGGKKADLSSHIPLAAQFAQRQGAATAAEAEAFDQEVALSVLPGLLRFDLPSFTVAAGTTVRLVFSNPGEMPHNAVIITPGSTDAVGMAADQLVGGDYVPDMESVLFATPMLDPGTSVVLMFEAPAEPGDYPYLCTFPGHWRLMQGTMVVTPP